MRIRLQTYQRQGNTTKVTVPTSAFILPSQSTTNPSVNQSPLRSTVPTMPSQKDYPSGPFELTLNPATPDGRKMFTQATSNLPAGEKRIDVNPQNSIAFMTQVKDDAAAFSWGKLVHAIPVSSTHTFSIIRENRKLKLDDVKKSALITFGDRNANHASPIPVTLTVEKNEPWNDPNHEVTYERRMRSKVIANRLRNILTKSSWYALMARKTDFSWTCSDGEVLYDGPTMLYMLIQKAKP